MAAGSPIVSATAVARLVDILTIIEASGGSQPRPPDIRTTLSLKLASRINRRRPLIIVGIALQFSASRYSNLILLDLHESTHLLLRDFWPSGAITLFSLAGGATFSLFTIV